MCSEVMLIFCRHPAREQNSQLKFQTHHMNHRVQVVIADDHEIYRDGLRVLLEKSNRIVLTGEASTGKQLIALCEEALPDVILTDVMMPVMDGIGAATYIAQHFPSVRIIALSMFNDDNLILDMLNAG